MPHRAGGPTRGALRAKTAAWLDAPLIALMLSGFVAWFGGLISLAAYDNRMNRFDLSGIPQSGPVPDAETSVRAVMNRTGAWSAPLKARSIAHSVLADYYQAAGDSERSRSERQKADFLDSGYMSRVRFI